MLREAPKQNLLEKINSWWWGPKYWRTWKTLAKNLLINSVETINSRIRSRGCMEGTMSVLVGGV